jgi:hypothetical protein
MDDATRKQFINGYEAELNRMGDELTRLAGYRSQLRPYTMLKDSPGALPAPGFSPPKTSFKKDTQSKLLESARTQRGNGVSKSIWISTIKKAHPGYSGKDLGKIYDSVGNK